MHMHIKFFVVLAKRNTFDSQFVIRVRPENNEAVYIIKIGDEIYKSWANIVKAI